MVWVGTSCQKFDDSKKNYMMLLYILGILKSFQPRFHGSWCQQVAGYRQAPEMQVHWRNPVKLHLATNAGA
jgi:hypothetical protein